MVGEGSKPPSSSSSPSEVKPTLSPAANMVGNLDDKDKVGSFGRKNKLSRRSFSRYVKAIIFETSLVKKLRNKKLGQKLHQIYNSDKLKFKSKSKPKKIFNSMDNNNAPFEDNHSTRSTISKFPSCLCTNFVTNSSSSASSSSSSSSLMTASSCSSSSSLSWNSRPSLSESVENNMQGKVGKGNGMGCHDFNVGVCGLLLVSLLVLVLWGKVCAIFCTSTWLFFFANRRTATSTKCDPSKSITVDDHYYSKIDSKLYKKKIIMEGLPERNHS